MHTDHVPQACAFIQKPKLLIAGISVATAILLLAAVLLLDRGPKGVPPKPPNTFSCLGPNATALKLSERRAKTADQNLVAVMSQEWSSGFAMVFASDTGIAKTYVFNFKTSSKAIHAIATIDPQFSTVRYGNSVLASKQPIHPVVVELFKSCAK